MPFGEDYSLPSGGVATSFLAVLSDFKNAEAAQAHALSFSQDLDEAVQDCVHHVF